MKVNLFFLQFKSKLSDHDDAETANTILKQLENELEITFKEFQLKNSEKEKEALVNCYNFQDRK